MVGRATINVGLRVDGVSGYLPAQTSPAGTYVEARSFPETDVFDFGPNVAPRLGVSYDLFGNGRTALKAYYGRFYNQFGSEISKPPTPTPSSTRRVPWTDTNGNLRARSRGAGPVHRLPARPVPDRRRGATRPYSEESTSASSSSWPATSPSGSATTAASTATGSASSTPPGGRAPTRPIDRTYVDPSSGQTQVDHHLQPEAGVHHARDRYISNVEFLESDYDGVTVRLPEADVEPLADAGRPEPAAAPRLRSQRHLHRRGTAFGYATPNS